MDMNEEQRRCTLPGCSWGAALMEGEPGACGCGGDLQVAVGRPRRPGSSRHSPQGAREMVTCHQAPGT